MGGKQLKCKVWWGKERDFQSAVFVTELEDAWRHGASPVCREMGSSERGYRHWLCLW